MRLLIVKNEKSREPNEGRELSDETSGYRELLAVFNPRGPSGRYTTHRWINIHMISSELHSELGHVESSREVWDPTLFDED